MIRFVTLFSPLAAVLARIRTAFWRGVDVGLKPFIVVDDDRIIGETVEKDDTDVAAKAAIKTIRRFDMEVDEVIVDVFFVCIEVMKSQGFFAIGTKMRETLVETAISEFFRPWKRYKLYGKCLVAHKFPTRNERPSEYR